MEKSPRRLAWPVLHHDAWLVFIAALVIQTAVWMNYRHSPFYEGLICDAKYYADWARALMASHGVSHEVFYQAPFYAYFIAAIWSVCGTNPAAVFLAQIILNACAAALLFLMGRAYGGRQAGWLAALLYCFYGMLTFYALKLLSEIPAVFLHVLLAFLLTGKTSPLRRTAAGIACGLLILTKPHALLFVPLILIYLSLHPRRESLRARFCAAACFVIPVLLLAGAAVWHNFKIERRFVPVAANGGLNFYIGNSPEANGIFCYVDDISPGIGRQYQTARAAAEQKAGPLRTKAEVSDFWFREGIKCIREDWRRFLQLEWRKLTRLLSPIEYSSMFYLSFEQKHFTHGFRLLFVNFALLLPLAAAGAAALIRNWRAYLICWMMIFVTAFYVLIFFMDERFRLPMVPFLILIAAGGLVKGLQTVFRRSEPVGRRVGTALIMAMAAVLAAGGLKLDPGRPSVEHSLYLHVGDVYYERADYQKALEAYYQSFRLAGCNWEAEMEISKVIFAMGHKETALKLYRQALPNLSPAIRAEYLSDKNFASLQAIVAADKATNKIE